jgi:hypothetical protein
LWSLAAVVVVLKVAVVLVVSQLVQLIQFPQTNHIQLLLVQVLRLLAVAKLV